MGKIQSRSQSPRYPYPAERETRDSGIRRFGSHSPISFPVPLDKGNAGSGNEIGVTRALGTRLGKI